MVKSISIAEWAKNEKAFYNAKTAKQPNKQ